jgi:hypothetical protein
MSHALHTRDDWKQAREELQALVAEWDPIDLLTTGAPLDEYDALVWPLMEKLDRGADADEISVWLAAELPRRFGAATAADEVERFCRRTAKWFHARWPMPERG